MSGRRREAESLPADLRFNPAHPDHAGWANGPKPLDMPAEAGIVAAHDSEQADEDEKPKTTRKR